jgi:hypothetical protein
MNMTTHETRAHGQAVRSPALTGKIYSDEMIYCGSKNDLCKKLGPRLIRAKGQTHPDSSEIDRSLRKIQKIILKVYTMKQ